MKEYIKLLEVIDSLALSNEKHEELLSTIGEYVIALSDSIEEMNKYESLIGGL